MYERRELSYMLCEEKTLRHKLRNFQKIHQNIPEFCRAQQQYIDVLREYAVEVRESLLDKDEARNDLFYGLLQDGMEWLSEYNGSKTKR